MILPSYKLTKIDDRKFILLYYLIPACFFLIAGYETMKDRKLLLLEKGKLAKQSKKWKDVLRTHEDGIMICIQSDVVFHNRALENLLSIPEDTTNIKYIINNFFQGYQLGESSVRCEQLGLGFICGTLTEGSYSLLKDGALKYTIQKKPIIFKESDAILLIIRNFTPVENMQRRATEDKFRGVLLSTISHDFKTPLTAIQNNLSLLSDYVPEAGKDFYNATCIASKSLEYYLFDIIVWFFFER